MDLHLDTVVLILAACAAVAALTLRLRQSVIIGYFIAGTLIGPHGFDLVGGGEARVEHLGEIGVVFLLFLLGTELSLERLRPLARPALLGGTLQIILTIAAAMGLTRLYGWGWQSGAYLGCVIALSSTAIVVKLLAEEDGLRAPHGKFSLGVLLFQDLAVVPMMVILPALSSTGGQSGWDLAAALGRAGAFLALSFVVARWILPFILRWIVRRRSQELFTLTVLSLALGMAVLSQSLGLSLAMGAFIAGLTLGQSPYSYKILADVLPFRDAFLSLFFVSIGMLLDLPAAAANAPVIASVVVLIIIVKTMVCAGVGRLLGLPLGMAVQAGLALSQVGEFSFLLIRMGHRSGDVDATLYQVMITSSVVTMAITPWLMKIGGVASRWRIAGARAGGAPPPEKPAPEGHGLVLKDHFVICGYGPVGRIVAAALRETAVPYIVLELNPDTVERARRDGITALYGDARSEVFLEGVGIGRARGLVVAIPSAEIAEAVVRNARLQVPGLQIYARAVFQANIRRLQDAGATVTVNDEREAGLGIARSILEKDGRTSVAAKEILDRIR